MKHILETSHEELERTHDLIEKYKPSGLKERIHSFFGKSFKAAMYQYAQKKEEVIISYTSLYDDMQKDIQNSHAVRTDVVFIRDVILQMTEDIELCGKYLEEMIDHAHGKKEIIHHEKVFFAGLLTSFNGDLLYWVGAHEKEVFGESNTPLLESGNIPLEEGKKILIQQKKRLENHIKNIESK